MEEETKFAKISLAGSDADGGNFKIGKVLRRGLRCFFPALFVAASHARRLALDGATRTTR